MIVLSIKKSAAAVQPAFPSVPGSASGWKQMKKDSCIR